MSDQMAIGMRAKRSSPARLKLEIARIRSIDPGRKVFVFEGKEDKLAYRCWIKRCVDKLTYEPLVADGKGNVLDLSTMIARDLTGSFDQIFFFVDRDFDELRGTPEADVIFCTEAYSVENYLVHSDVVDEVLIDYFGCHGHIQIRERILAAFRQSQNAFHNVSVGFNQRIFFARKLMIPVTGGLPEIGTALGVCLDDCTPRSPRFEEIRIGLLREPTAEEMRLHLPQFSELDPAMRYRGKYALEFFRKWLRRLCEDNNSASSCMFTELNRKTVDSNVLNIATFAMSSPLPEGLNDFVSRIAA